MAPSRNAQFLDGLKSEKGKGLVHWAWVIVAASFINLFVNYSVRLGYGVMLPEMIQNLGLSRTAGGSIYNAYLFSYITFTPLTGYLTDKIGARRVITICCAILALGVLLMGTIDALWTACLFYAIAGIGSSGIWTPVQTLVQRWFSPNRRGLALGLVGMGSGTGLATMGLAFPWIVNHYNWRYGWYFLGLAALLVALINGFFLRSDPQGSGYLPWGQPDEPSGAEKSAVTDPGKRGTLSIVFADIRFWLIGMSYFSITYSLYGIATFMVDYARYQIGLPLERASLLATIHGSFMVIGALTILPLSDYVGRKKAIAVSNSCIAVFLIMILLAGTHWKVLFVIVGCLALFYGPTFSMYSACAGDYFPREVIGTVIGAWTAIYGFGAISSHWVGGVLRDTTGIYDYAFLIDAIMAFTGFVLISLIRKN